MSRFSDLFSNTQPDKELFSAEIVSEGLEIANEPTKEEEIYSAEKLNENKEIFITDSSEQYFQYRSYKKAKK